MTATLENVDTAPLEEPLRATLKMLRKLTKEHEVTAEDMKTVLAAGVTKQQIQDAINIAFCFNVLDRLADTFEFFVRGRDALAADAKFLLSKRGYII